MRFRPLRAVGARWLQGGVIFSALVLALVSTPGGVREAAAACTTSPIRTWSANDHKYQMICVDGITWDEADAAAKKKGAHLATITSEAENDFIADNFPDEVAWIGGFQPAGTSEPSGGWRWVTNESFKYENWNGGEPNDAGGEDHLVINWDQPGGWNDLAGDSEESAYIIEWEPEEEPDLLDNNQGRFIGGALFGSIDTAAQNRARANAAGAAAIAPAASAPSTAAVRPPSTGDGGLVGTETDRERSAFVAAAALGLLGLTLATRMRRQRFSRRP